MTNTLKYNALVGMARNGRDRKMPGTTLARRMKQFARFMLERYPGTRLSMERRARIRAEAELKAKEDIRALMAEKSTKSAFVQIMKRSLSETDTVPVEKGRLDRIYDGFSGENIGPGGPYRISTPLPEERQDELAKEFVRSYEEVEYNPRKRLAIMTLKLPQVYLMILCNMLIAIINMASREKKLTMMRTVLPPSRRTLEEEAAARKQEQAYNLLKSGKVTSGRAQYVLATLIDSADAKDLLNDGTVTNEMAQIELVERIETSSDARELLSSEKEFKESVYVLLREKAGLPASLPSSSKKDE